VHFLTGLVKNRRDVRLTVILQGKTGSGSCESAGLRYILGIAGESGIGCAYAPGGCPDENGFSILTRIARENAITKFATAQSLDDAALSTLVSFLTGKPEELFGNSGGLHPETVPIITPFISVPASEVSLYAQLTTGISGGICVPPERDEFSGQVKEMLDKYTERHPATKYSLMHLAGSIRNTASVQGEPAVGAGPANRGGEGPC
jgi:hypothetical protein